MASFGFINNILILSVSSLFLGGVCGERTSGLPSFFFLGFKAFLCIFSKQLFDFFFLNLIFIYFIDIYFILNNQ
jgi:hypothetical protein